MAMAVDVFSWPVRLTNKFLLLPACHVSPVTSARNASKQHCLCNEASESAAARTAGTSPSGPLAAVFQRPW
jgi:hypothetical protein